MDVIHLPPLIYSPIPSSRHIRVLVIQQAEGITAPLHAKLSDLGLDDEDRISYTALSYTWGIPELTEQLVINDAICKITPNLAGALRHLRQMGCMRLWADAVCIDQKNDAEKSLQIPLMDNIYRNASRVLIWLGDRSEDIQLLKVVRSGCCGELHFPNPYAFAPGSGLGSGSGSGSGSELGEALEQAEGSELSSELSSELREPSEPREPSELGEALHQLLQLPWFSRRWVIQELVLNFNVSFLCGTVEISFAGLAALVCDPLMDEAMNDSKSVRSFQNLWRLWKTLRLPQKEPDHDDEEGFGILDLQKSFDHFECFDARDRIFALLGIAEDINQDASFDIDRDAFLDIDQEIFLLYDGSDIDIRPERPVFNFRPDYAKNTEKVYTDFALSVVRAGFLCLMLEEAMARPCISGQLPSWVPDWRVSPKTSSRDKDLSFGDNGYQFRPTQCGRYFTLTAPMLQSIILESETKTTAPQAYSPPIKVNWTSSPAHESWSSWAAEAIVSAWEFIITGSQWMKSFTLETQIYILKKQEALWIHLVHAAIYLAFGAVSNVWKPLQLLGDDEENFMEEIFIHPCTQLREKMLRQCEREFENEGSVQSERSFDGYHDDGNSEGSHIGWFILSVVPMSEGVYVLSSAPPRMSSLIVEPGDEILLAGMGYFVTRQVDSLDSKVPVYSIINTSSNLEFFDAKGVTKFRDKVDWTDDQRINAVIQHKGTFDIVLA